MKKLKLELLADAHNATETDNIGDAVGNESRSGAEELLDVLASESTLFRVNDDWPAAGGDSARDTIRAQRGGGSWGKPVNIMVVVGQPVA